MRFFLLILMCSLVISCKKDNPYAVDVTNVSVDFSVDRLDIDFYKTTSTTLPQTKAKYPLLFPEATPDSIWLQRIQNKDERELFDETQKVFATLATEEQQLRSLFKHVKYYNPKFKAPKVITLLTNIDYDNRVIYADSLLLISLDTYLGANHPFYQDYPKYISQNNHKKHLIVDVANSIIKKQFQHSNNRSFLGKIIHEGKKLYVADLYLPKVPDYEKIGYTQEKMNWAIHNEQEIWKYFIEHKLLYSTDTKLNGRFIDTAPFSKFYLAHDNESPGRLGVWIGWQIVRAFMQNNDVSLQELLKLDTEHIFKNSKYKPKK